MACVNLVFPLQKINSNETLQRDTRGFRSLFHYDQVVWDNSDIKCMKNPSISSAVTEYLTFQLSWYLLWTIKINCRRFLGRLSTNVMTLLLIQIHSETNIFLSTKVIWEREKRGFISYLSAWGSDRRVCLKILPSRKTRYIYEKWQRKLGCTRRLTKALPWPVGRDRKILTGSITNQIARFVTMPS